MYELDFEEKTKKKLNKLANRDRQQAKLINKTLKKIKKNPFSSKPLKKPMQGQRRVQIGSFVLTYEINEKNKIVNILDYEHHNKVYKRN